LGRLVPRGMSSMPQQNEAKTQGVRVHVEPEYLADHSDPGANLWVHAYHVTITNESERVVQLVWRQWVITNANGTVERVSGPGVVGQQPVLKPGESFRYTSGCPLDTPVGTMHGTYRMVTEDGQQFEAEIAPFTLAEPYALN
jgi:ApaG protein